MAKTTVVKRGARTKLHVANPVRYALKTLGKNILDARRRRRITTELLAKRSSISRATLQKIERGDTGVAIGYYGAVLYSLALVDRLAEIGDLKTDSVGMMLEEERLPKRVRLPKEKIETNSKTK